MTLVTISNSVIVGASNNPYSKKFVVMGDSQSSGTWTATNFILSSARKLKRGIKDLQDIGWADDIRFREFQLKNTPDQMRYGVIAEEVEKVAPELINENADHKAVLYIDLLVVKMARLEERIKLLEEKLNDTGTGR